MDFSTQKEVNLFQQPYACRLQKVVTQILFGASILFPGLNFSLEGIQSSFLRTIPKCVAGAAFNLEVSFSSLSSLAWTYSIHYWLQICSFTSSNSLVCQVLLCVFLEKRVKWKKLLLVFLLFSALTGISSWIENKYIGGQELHLLARGTSTVRHWSWLHLLLIMVCQYQCLSTEEYFIGPF